ncbi:hypothetical protein ACOSP7_022149 [Xanthoceras sorbifolium]
MEAVYIYEDLSPWQGGAVFGERLICGVNPEFVNSMFKAIALVDMQKVKGVDLKQKGVLSEVTNLKEKTRPVKKTKKAKTSGSAGVSTNFKKKASVAAKSKIKMQLAFNTSSENGSQSGKAGFFEENFQVDSIDKSQSI